MDDFIDEGIAAPPPARPQPSARARALVRAMRLLTTVTAALSVGAIVWLWASPARLTAKLLPVLGIDPRTADLGWWSRLAGFLLTLPPLLVLLFALWNVRGFFEAFGDGDILSARAARRVRAMALAVGALALLRPLIRAGYGWLLGTVGVPALPGVGIGDVLALLFSVVLFAMGIAIAEAARLRDELDQIL